MTLLILVWVILVLFLIFIVYMMWRNNQVFNYRNSLLDQVHKAGEQDISAGRNWMWRYEAFDSVNYNHMVLSFKKLDSFYKDKSFLDPDGREPSAIRIVKP